MVSLGGIVLSEHLTLNNLISAPKVAINQRRFIGGDAHITTSTISGGDELILNGENHFTRAELLQIKNLEANGMPVALVHHLETCQVLITAVAPTAMLDRANPGDDALYSADITMIRVD
jgi:hypothetical protein